MADDITQQLADALRKSINYIPLGRSVESYLEVLRTYEKSKDDVTEREQNTKNNDIKDAMLPSGNLPSDSVPGPRTEDRQQALEALRMSLYCSGHGESDYHITFTDYDSQKHCETILLCLQQPEPKVISVEDMYSSAELLGYGLKSITKYIEKEYPNGIIIREE